MTQGDLRGKQHRQFTKDFENDAVRGHIQEIDSQGSRGGARRQRSFLTLPRAGFPTSEAGNSASIFKMMDVSRHKSVDTQRGYVRDAELFKGRAGAGLL